MTDGRNLPSPPHDGGPVAPRGNGAFGSPGRPRAPERAADEIELREVFEILRRHAWLVAGAMVLCVAGAFAFIRLQHPEYRAQATIRVVDARKAMTAGLEAPGLDQLVGRTTDPLLSQIQVLRSRRVAGVVVDREGLRLAPESPAFPRDLVRGVVVEDPSRTDTLKVRFEDTGFQVEGAVSPTAYGGRAEADGFAFAIAADPDMDEATFVLRSRPAAIDALQEQLTASARDQTDVVDVTYVGHDPHLARRVVNSVVEAYQEEDRRSAQDEARRRRVFIEEQLAGTDSLLTATHGQLSAFRSSKEMYSSDARLSAEQAGMMELDVRREELAAQRRMYDRLLVSARKAEGRAPQREALRALVSVPEMAQNPVIASLYQKLAAYGAARDSVTEGEWGSAHTNPDVTALDSLIQRTEGDLLDAAGSHVASLAARVQALDELKARNAATMRRLPATESEEARLVQRFETIKNMADQLREEYQKAQISEAVEAGQVEILDAAPLPDEPIGTGTPLKLALAAMLGLMLGSGGAFLREHMDTAIRRKDDIERVLGLTPLGVVPRLHTGNGNGRRIAGRRVPALGKGQRVPVPAGANGNGKVAAGGGGGAGGEGSGRAIGSSTRELVVLHDARSSGAEAYRTLRTNLLFSQLGEELRIIVVTSSGEAEGKTTAASNLATTFAQQGVRVLVVDADLRKARLHRVFGATREPGLTELLMGRAGAEDAVRATEVDGLFVLPSGALPPNPSEVLGSARMRELVEKLRENFELIIFDTPPLLAAGDAAILGARADGVVMVVRAGQTDQGAAREAVRQLDNVRARILGAVLNDPDATVPKYGGYYQYAYYGE